MPRFSRYAVLLAAVAIAAACTNADEIFVPNIGSTNFAASLGVDLTASTKTASGLYYRDISVGGGTQVPAEDGTRVTIQYTGWLRNGVEFDAGTISFTTGTGEAITGMDEGVREMRVGGVRQVIIPPGLGYGNNDSGTIPGQSILVFRVTLLSIG